VQKTILKAAIVSLVIVSILTLLFFKSNSNILVFLLYPGAIVALLMLPGGAHGGTLAQEHVARMAMFVVNVLAYTIILTVLFRLFRRMLQRT